MESLIYDRQQALCHVLGLSKCFRYLVTAGAFGQGVPFYLQPIGIMSMRDQSLDSETPSLVLVVDDDPTIRLLTRHTLKKAGFEVEEAGDGAPALDIFQQRRPDIVLLDVMMPEMDGFATCAALRKMPEGRHVPILMVTGLDDVDSINHAYEAGATDFITKPITYPLLGHRVRYVLRASQAMEKLGKSEARLAHAQSLAHVGNWEWDVTRDKLYCSEEIHRIIGLSCEGFKGHESFLRVVHPDDREMVRAAMDRSMRDGESYSLDHRINLPDGGERIVHQQGETLKGEDGQVLRMNGTLQDITERKQVENELKQYRNHLEELVTQRTAELTEANAKLRDAKEQAEQANNLKDKFISLVAHDLRSPLAGIIAALEYLHTDDEFPLHEEHQEIVERLIHVGKSLVQMIEDVLNIGRLKSGKITPHLKLIEGRESVEAVIQNLSYLAKQKGVELLNEIPSNTRLYADPALFGEVVQNLTSNGIKFCRKGDRIRFYMKDATVLAVEDSGVGIAEDALPKLFRIEEKTTTTGTSGEKGTGFGLPFSQDIMLAHGGQLEVTSELNQGTTFFICLPPMPQDIKETLQE